METKFKTTSVFHITLLALRCFGLYPAEDATPWYFAYSFLLNLTVTVWFPVTVITQIFFTTDPKVLFATMSVAFPNAMSAVKTLNALYQHKNLRLINELLERLDERVRIVKDADEQSFLARTVKIANRIFLAYFIPFTIAALTCELPMLFSDKRQLLYSSWHPFDWRNSDIAYHGILVYQFIATYIQVYLDLLNDVYPGLYLWVLRGHYRALSIRVSKIGYETGKSFEENYKDLRDCIVDHKMILEYREIFERIFSGVFLIHFFITEITLCCVAVLTRYINNQGEALHIYFFFVCMTMEIWLPCFCGNEIVHENEIFRNALFSCNWMDQDIKFKKALIVAMLKTQKVVSIKAGGIVDVSLTTFVTVLKTAYSLFAIIQQMG